ncbi:hypothetical protein D3C86_1454710 [compost metagenome]
MPALIHPGNLLRALTSVVRVPWVRGTPSALTSVAGMPCKTHRPLFLMACITSPASGSMSRPIRAFTWPHFTRSAHPPLLPGIMRCWNASHRTCSRR